MDIIIVNWNSGSQLSHCIDSLLGIPDIHIIVVDNASSDGSENFLAGNDKVTLIRSSENLGFGKACNLGAKHARSDYVLFLNPDAAVYPDTLEIALAFMRDPQHADVGICGVQLKDESGHVSRSCWRFPTPLGFLAHASGLDRLFPSIGNSMAEWSHDTTREVDQVIGAFFLVRRRLFEALEGFDEQFFVYFEEVDFSKRARQAGWRSVYLADAQAFHAGGGTSNQVKARRLFYALRSQLIYASKHFNLSGFVLTCVAALFIEPVTRSMFAIGQCSWEACKETWSAYGMLWKWLPHWVLNRSSS